MWSGRWRPHAARATSAAWLRCSSTASTASVESMEAYVSHVTSGSQLGGALGHRQTRHVEELTDPPLSSSSSSPFIHPTAVVHPNASIGRNVHIGPYSIIGPDVELDDGVFLKAHVVVEGRTLIGSDTVVHPFACIGGEPQDKKHSQYSSSSSSSRSSLVVGRNCVIREHVTIHGSTSYTLDTPTKVGDDCWLLCGAHIGHDCDVGDRVVLSNNVCVAGHVQIGDFAIIGGQVGLKQHVKIGSLAMIGGKSAVDGDVLPYGLAIGNRAKLAGLNLIGLRRAKVSRHEIKLMLRVYRYLFGVTSSCSKTGFAPALDLAPRDSIVLRAEEVKMYLLENQIAPESHRMVHEMVDFVLDSPSRFRSSLCQAATASSPLRI